MKDTVERAATGESVVRAGVAAAWPTGARIPWLPVIETDQTGGEVAKRDATADRGVEPLSDDSRR